MSKHQSPETEAWVLGALMDADGPVLRSDARTLLAASGLNTEDFCRPNHRAWLDAITALAERNRPADAQTVYSNCRGLAVTASDTFEAMQSLQNANQANKTAFLAHAEELRRLTQLRRLETFHRAQIDALGADRPEPAKLASAIDTFSQSFAPTNRPYRTGQADLANVLQRWDAFNRGIQQAYFPTGIQVVDQHINGFVPNLNILGGRPSVGKTAFAASCIINALAAGRKVGLFGLEDGTEPITERWLARELGIELGLVGACRLHPHQQEDLAQASARWHELTANFSTYPWAGATAKDLVRHGRDWILNHGVEMIVIDHGGELQHESTRDRHDLAVASNAAQLRDLGVTHNVPVLMLYHFRRDTDHNDGAPGMDALSDSSKLENMARLILGLWEDTPEPTEELLCTIIKQTKGAHRGATLALQRNLRAGLVRSNGGGLVDLKARQQLRQERARASRLADASPARSWQKGGHS